MITAIFGLILDESSCKLYLYGTLLLLIIILEAAVSILFLFDDADLVKRFMDMAKLDPTDFANTKEFFEKNLEILLVFMLFSLATQFICILLQNCYRGALERARIE